MAPQIRRTGPYANLPRGRNSLTGGDPGVPEGETAGELPQTQALEAVADQIESSALPFRVVNAEGDVVGSIGRQAVIDVLIGRKPAP